MKLARIEAVTRDPVYRMTLPTGHYVEFVREDDAKPWQQAMDDYWNAGAEAMRADIMTMLCTITTSTDGATVLDQIMVRVAAMVSVAPTSR